MNIIIIGCSRIGAELSSRLGKHNHRVVVVDRNKLSFTNLPRDFRGRTHTGDPFSREVLLRAGIQKADALIALTESDTENAVIGLISREIFNIPKVIVRNNDPEFQEICQVMGLQVISSAKWGAEQLEEMLCYTDINSLLSMGGGEVEIYAIVIPDEWDDQPFHQFIHEDLHIKPVVITRSGRALMASSGFIMKRGDILHVAADHEGMESIRNLITSVSKGD